MSRRLLQNPVLAAMIAYDEVLDGADSRDLRAKFNAMEAALAAAAATKAANEQMLEHATG